jgi:drug/metabolite transporter, DME family
MRYFGNSPMSPSSTSRVSALTAALLFSTAGAAIKWVPFGAWQIAGCRSAIAAIAIFTLLPASRRGWSLRVVPAAAAYAFTLVLFVTATKLTTAANAIFLQSTAPLYVLLLGPLVLKEHIRRSDLSFAAAVGMGLALFFVGRETAAATAPDPLRGNILGALSGIAWALTLISLRWFGKRSHSGDGALASVVLGNIIASAVSLPMAFPFSPARAFHWALLAYLGIFQIGLAYLLVARAMRHLPAFETTTLLLVEPVFNPIWTWLIHGERPAPWALAGGALILTATFIHTCRESRTHRPPVRERAKVRPTPLS